MCKEKETQRPSPPKYEVADVLRKFGYDYLKKGVCNEDQYKVLSILQCCRTAVLGGKRMQCQECHHEEIVFSSCRNRHCPKCQFLAREKWLQKQEEDLLPVSYYHFVATLPHHLNPWIDLNKREMLGLFFRTINSVLQAFARDPQWRLEGELGLLSVLHTWNQKMETHYHIHNLIPGGVLKKDGTWKVGRKGFLFKKTSLGKALANAYLKGLSRLHLKGTLLSPKSKMGEDLDLVEIIEKLRTKKWVVYLKKPFGGPRKVLKYLGRYTHRIAISNHRILEITEETVTFSYLNRSDKTKKPVRKSLTLNGPEFVKRFLSHVLPSGMMKIRHYGILGSRLKKEKLEQIRSQCKVLPEELALEEVQLPEKEDSPELFDGPVCSKCKKGVMMNMERIEKRKVQKLPRLFYSD